MLSFESSLCVLDPSALLDMWLANIFSQSLLMFFTLSRVFHRAKVSNFVEVQFIIFYFGAKSKSSLPSFGSQRFSFFSKRLILSIKPMIHLELIVVNG